MASTGEKSKLEVGILQNIFFSYLTKVNVTKQRHGPIKSGQHMALLPFFFIKLARMAEILQIPDIFD